ncbi:hypothetical protein SAPIO_CDS10860 [Scedosporium apiospermum]|uniref:Uncharacterized protein n=1 Tax=Pseudallescheria apiosperma TaxID=563466 RepID=A0A084FUQ6_PSEDA|nr:uncharacterized protein SAPIO_CDS10860 [Scedosporium apiospermum]KEZ38818.1 hypothetical protein SAPIO_CDS10860 [Scedosporium apiospermum]
MSISDRATMDSSDWETICSSNGTDGSISNQTPGSNGEAFATDNDVKADTNPSRQSKWLPLPTDPDLRQETLLETDFTALLLKPAENCLDRPTIEYLSLTSMDEARQWFDEATAAAEVPQPDGRGNLQVLSFHRPDFNNSGTGVFKEMCVRGGPVRETTERYTGFAGLSRYRWPPQTTATDEAKREGSSNDDARPDPDPHPLQRLVYDIEIETWLPFGTLSYFPQSKTTVLAMMIDSSVPSGSVKLLEYMATAVEDDHDRAFRDPLMFQHPLSGLLIVISMAVNDVMNDTPHIIDHILAEAGFHQYSNLTRRDARLIPSRDLSILTSDAVAYSVDLAQSDGTLMGLSRMLRYLRDENEELNRLGYFDSPELQRVRHLIDEWSRYIEYRSDSLSQYTKAWQHQANALIQGLQNVITQKNQDSTLAIAHESRRIAEASWKDTTSVTAITLITMLFLPATFMATLFSAKFFEDSVYNGDANRQATTYLATTFPLTAVVIFLWYAWVWFRRRRANVVLGRRQRLDMEDNEDLESKSEREGSEGWSSSGDLGSQSRRSEDLELQSRGEDLKRSARKRMMGKMNKFLSSR